MKNLGYITFAVNGGELQSHRVIELVPMARVYRLGCGLSFNPAHNHVPEVTPEPTHTVCPGCSKPL